MLLDYTLHRIDIYIYKKRQIRVTAKPSTNARTIYLVEQQRPNKSGSYIETTYVQPYSSDMQNVLISQLSWTI